MVSKDESSEHKGYGDKGSGSNDGNKALNELMMESRGINTMTALEATLDFLTKALNPTLCNQSPKTNLPEFNVCSSHN